MEIDENVNVISDERDFNIGDEDQSAGLDFFVPECEEQYKPYIGQSFNKLEEVYDFYKNYGRKCGFDVRRSSEKKHNDGTVVSKYYVCNREGYSDCSGVQVSSVGESKILNSRRTLSGRCGCLAKVVARFKSENGYVICHFDNVHNHLLADNEGKIFMKFHKQPTDAQKAFIFGAAKVNIGPMKAHSLMKEIVGGFANVGATSNDFKNISRDVRAFIGDADSEMILQKFKDKKEISEGFFSKYFVDSYDQLSRLFWADPIARRNYDLFGDVVSFDATFRTNKYDMVFVPFTGVDNHKKSVTFAAGLLAKEDIESYTWIFECFMEAMQREPTCINTDQCPSLKQAIPSVFTTCRHRLCMWHIMKKFPSKIGTSWFMYHEFVEKVKNFIWDNEISHSEFEEGWNSVLSEYGLTENKWLMDLYANRRSWIPAYFRDDPMLGILRTTSRSESENSFFGTYNKRGNTLCEFYLRFESAMEKQRYVNSELNHASFIASPTTVTPLSVEKYVVEVYTRNVFYDVQKEIKASCYELTIESLMSENGMKIFKLKEKVGKKKSYEVCYKIMEEEFDCSCTLFTRVGILCSHVFYVMNQCDIERIPKEYLLTRWRKNAERMISNSNSIQAKIYSDTMGNNSVGINDLWFTFQSCLSKAGMRGDKMELIKCHLDALNMKLAEDADNIQSNSKNRMIETYVGKQPLEKIIVQLPIQSRNKGCGKRLKSSSERHIEVQLKPKRKCKLCKKFCNHDSRNCPSRNN